MRSLWNPIVVIAALLCISISVRGFPPRRSIRPSSRRTARYIRSGSSFSRFEEQTTIFSGALSITHVSPLSALLNDETESEKWTLEEDWALMDSLPQYTVSSTTETKTFWTQLWSANALLFSKRQPKDLYRRVQELEYQQSSSEHDGQKTIMQNTEKNSSAGGSSSTSSKHERSPLLTHGPSPPVLENWRLDVEGMDNQVVGQVNVDGSGQRTIWFHYHVIGRLEGDPFTAAKSSSTSITSAVSLFPGGYIEAVGGRIYELGQPMFLDEWGRDKPQQETDTPTSSTSRDDNNEESSILSRWWIPGSTAAISALVSSTILSACIGYGAGLAIISDSPHRSSTHSTTPTTMLTIEPGLAAAGGSSSGGPSSDNSPADQTASTAELRARAEYRILREERLLQRISQRLEFDKQNLKQLEQQHQQQQQQEQQSSQSQLRP